MNSRSLVSVQGHLRTLVLLATAAASSLALAAAPQPQFVKAPPADLHQPTLWGSQCEMPDGQGLRFGGIDQAADDGAVHTQIRRDGSWQPIFDQLRRGNPLQSHRDAVWRVRDELKRTAAAARFRFLDGERPDRAVNELHSALVKVAVGLDDALVPLRLLQSSNRERLSANDRSQFNRAMRRLDTAAKALAGAKAAVVTSVSVAALEDLWQAQVALEQAAECFDCEPALRALSPIVYDAKNQLYVVFGGDHLDYLTNDTWVFDPARQRWQQRQPPSVPPPRANHTLTAAGDGTIRLAGGFTHNNTDIWYMGPLYQLRDDDDWIYDVAADTWTSASGTPGVAPDQRAYRTGPFMPGFFLQGDAPDAAANQARLAALPANTWTVMDPPAKPRINRDWGSACIDPDHDVLLRFSGGHCAHGGSDVLIYHFATNRWELPFPVEFPLGQCYSNTSYPAGFNFNRRPWVSGHTYKNYGYDPVDKLMVFTGHNPWSYLFDPAAGDWIDRTRKPPLMNYDGSFYTLTLCTADRALYAWCGQYDHSIGLAKWQPGQRTWEAVETSGEKLPCPQVDHSGLAYDARRDRLLFFPKQYDGTLYALDCKSRVLSKLVPAGAVDTVRPITFWRELAYVPGADWVVNVGHLLPAEGDSAEAVRPALAYDCGNNCWLSVTIPGPAPTGKTGRNVSQGSAWDAKRGLIWATNTDSQVYVLRLDAAHATTKRL